MIRLAAAALAVIALSVGCSSQDTSERTKPNAPDRSVLSWETCDVGPGVECAHLEVPLDWSEPDRKQIQLALARKKATGERRGSLVMNPGGPGGSGLDLISYDPTTAAIAEHFDRVSWDPRGVGRSHGLECGSTVPKLLTQDPDPDTDAEQIALEDAAAAVATECGTLDGELLSHMTTEDTARDLEAIRVALGSEPLNYLGFSYGTHIGQTYAELFPQNVSTMVLDGVVDPLESFSEFLLSQTAAFDKALVRQADQCAAAGEARCGVTELLASYDALHETVERKPVNAGGATVGPAELAMAGITSAYRADGWRVLGPALAEALGGDGSSLKSIADSYQDMAGYGPYAAVICSDRSTPRGHERYQEFAEEAMRVSERFGGAIANELLPCATWPVQNESESSELDSSSLDGIPPILLIGNVGDPATPFENARRVHARIKDSALITVRSDGHTAFGSDQCVNAAVEDYLLRGALPSGDARTCQ